MVSSARLLMCAELSMYVSTTNTCLMQEDLTRWRRSDAGSRSTSVLVRVQDRSAPCFKLEILI